MKLNSSRVLVSVLGLSFLLANHTFSFGADKAPFYQGKTLNIVINFAAGGPTDIESRVLAKHLVKHIPGQPAITIQAMGGGGGVTSPDVPELLPFTDFYKQIFGKAPTGIKYEALKAANMSSTNLQRLILLPPGAPAEAMAVLRQAFAALSKDSDFIADALKTIRFHPRFDVAEQGERMFQRVSQTPPDVINFIRQYIEQANR